MPEIVMPRLSDSMEEGTILSWLKAEGDEVALGEELVEIETDKANMAYEADVAGTLTKILAQEGETLAIGSPIAVIGEPGGADAEGSAPDAEGPASAAAGPDEGESPAGGAAAPFSDSPPRHPRREEGADGEGSGGGERVKASPLARRLAEERGIELASLSGSGPGGRVVKADVEGAAAAGTGGLATSTRREEVASPPVPSKGGEGETAKGSVEVVEPNKLQQVIARRMSEAKATAPHFYLTTEVDMTRAVEARRALKEAAKDGDVVPSFNDMVVKACAIALKEFPKANSAYKDGKFELYSRVNVGVAVAAPGALVVPTVFDADRKGLRQIASDARELAGKVRDGSITPPELSGATFTVSNLGMYGISEFEAVINLPQAAILAVGAISSQPRFGPGGELREAQVMKATVSCDHRILYGAEGAEFLARIRALLEEPVSLAL
jgi:pyruvate dehydrogenase E2 component (dihydrolipoamide acetyltransferase)